MNVDIPMLMQAITIGVMLGGFIIAFCKLTLLIKQIRNQYEWLMRQCALSYHHAKNEQLQRAISNLNKTFGILLAKKEALTLNEIDEAVKINSSVYTDVICFLGHWENMALAIHAKIADETVALEMVAGMIISYVRVFRNFIERRRQTNPRAYDYRLALAKRWEDKLRQTKKPPFSDLRNI